MVRTATEADVETLAAMGARFIAETSYADTYQVNAAQFRAIAQRFIADADKLALVSERAGAVTGMLLASVFDHPLSGQRICSELVWWVNPEARGHGLRLLRALEQWAVGQGARVLQMICPRGEGIGRVYETRGYDVSETHYAKVLA